MAEGRSNQGIADKLVITLRAVEKYVSSIFDKLGLPSGGSDSTTRARRAALPALLTRSAAKTPETRPPDHQSPAFSRRGRGARFPCFHRTTSQSRGRREIQMKSVLIQQEAGPEPVQTHDQPICARHRNERHPPLRATRATSACRRCGASRSTSQAASSPPVMGPSGSGKSTLMHILAGLDRPNDGEVTIAGTDITDLDDTELTKLRREHIGFIFQFFNLLPMLTARENVVLPRQAGRREARPRVGRRADDEGRSLRAPVAPSVRALGWSAAAGRDRACPRQSSRR